MDESDIYEILCKGPDGSYAGVRKVCGLEEAKERMQVLQSTTPGSYLLLNLTTRMIEDQKGQDCN